MSMARLASGPRVSPVHRHWTDGIDDADSWTTDGHKWLNTPYDCAMAIWPGRRCTRRGNEQRCRLRRRVEGRRRRISPSNSLGDRVASWCGLRCGLSVAPALHHLSSVTALRPNDWLPGCRTQVSKFLNRVVLNQVIARGRTDSETAALRVAVENSGEAWFGPSVWAGRPAFRLSVSSWRTKDADIERLIQQLARLRADGDK